MTVYVFPGQGSQSLGMGAELFSEFPDLVEEANELLGYDICSLCLEQNEQLNQTQYTQPALYVVNALSYFKKLKDNPEKPDFVAGHSLGEYNALLAAEVFDFATGLKLVKKRGELMSQAKNGAMGAVIKLTMSEVQHLLQEFHLDLTIANYNSFTQNVLSGSNTNIELAKALFEERGALFIPLKVSGAFHSSFMTSAQTYFAEFVQDFDFKIPSLTVIANKTAQPYDLGNIKENLSDQITHPVLWTQSIQYLLKKGETQFEEIGPNNVLSGLINRIMKGK